MAAEGFGRIKLAVFDVDGVLTDGTFLLDEDGRESKQFHTQDGFGLRQLGASGIEVAIITGRRSGAVSSRMNELNISHVFQGSRDKMSVLAKLTNSLGIDFADTAFVGDDIPDLRVMQSVGIPIAVANAVEPVKAAAAYVTRARGGHGAVREVCDMLIAARAAS